MQRLLGRWEKRKRGQKTDPTRTRGGTFWFHSAMLSVTAVPGPMDGAGTTGQQPGDHATTPCHTQAGCRGLRAWTLVTTHSRKVRRRQRPTSACTNQLRRHWRPLTAIKPKASKARLTSGRAGPATGNSEPRVAPAKGVPKTIATTKPPRLRPNSQVHGHTSETG